MGKSEILAKHGLESKARKRQSKDKTSKDRCRYTKIAKGDRGSPSEVTVIPEDHQTPDFNGSENAGEFFRFGFPNDLCRYLSGIHDRPLEIQKKCWPLLVSGRDLIGIAPTGSGKSLAFGLPLLLKVKQIVGSNSGKRVKPLGLILTPTRELALQIQEVFRSIPYFSDVSTVCLYGGVPRSSQVAELKKGAHILVATPGRLLDLASDHRNTSMLSEVCYFVLDEADRMLDASFSDSVSEIVSKVGIRTQTLMFSATWGPKIQEAAEKYLRDYEKVVIGETNVSANVNITQKVELIEPLKKDSRLIKLIREFRKEDNKNSRIIVFALYKKEATRVGNLLNNNGLRALVIHSDINQFQRQKVITLFRQKTSYILVATDVASRGLDIPSVNYVINYTFPLTIEDYCHRIGRSGRVGMKGLSHTLFTLHDKSLSGALVNVLRNTNQSIPREILNLGGTVKRKVDPNYGVFAREIDKSVKGKKIVFDDSSSSEEE